MNGDSAGVEVNELREIQVAPGRVLRATPVFDTYWRFAARRQALFMKRVLGMPPPWTQDPVLAAHRFTNAYRAADRVSQYLISNVLYKGSQDCEELFFRAVLFKLFNRIETWEAIKTEVGDPTWGSFDPSLYTRVLDELMHRGERVYSAAYIMPSPSFGRERKHQNHLMLLEYMMRDGAPKRIKHARSLQDVYKILCSYPSLGSFLAFQFTIDLNYSTMLSFSEMDFVVAGPGARSGIQKCFADMAGFSEEDVIRAVADISRAEFDRLGLEFSDLWGRPLQLIDCQNLFCEVDKYSRAVHPEIHSQSGRKRIKQRFTHNPAPLPQWYPPKWRVTVPSARKSGVPSAGDQSSQHGAARQLALAITPSLPG